MKTSSSIIMITFFTLVFSIFLYGGFYLISLDSEEASEEIELEGEMILVWHSEEGYSEELPLEEVVFRALAGEMSGTSPEEALKAQAVAARTYIVKRLVSGGTHEDGAIVCDDPSHCQCFLDDEDLAIKFGSDEEMWTAYLKEIVASTEGVVLVADGELIDPLYSAVCGGVTELASEYWYTDLPAITNVECNWDTTHVNFTSMVVYSAEEVAERLGVLESDLDTLAIDAFTSTGRIGEVSCADTVWEGRDFRTALDLNSTNCSWVVSDGEYYFNVLGYGHGVGMCQAGACGLAELGYSYEAILEYYYYGSEVVIW